MTRSHKTDVHPAAGTPQIYRVRIGKFGSRREAETMATKLEKEERAKERRFIRGMRYFPGSYLVLIYMKRFGISEASQRGAAEVLRRLGY